MPMSAIYETDKLLAEYLLFHYGLPEEILPGSHSVPAGMREALDFPGRTVARFTPGHATESISWRMPTLGLPIKNQ